MSKGLAYDEDKDLPDKLLLETYKGSAAPQGGNNGLVIYQINHAATKTPLGTKAFNFIRDLNANPAQFDDESGYNKGSHGNDHKNLPDFPPGDGQYIEYFIDQPGNSMKKKGNLRFIRDTVNNRIYVSVTHYDSWTNVVAEKASKKKVRRNGFYLVVNIQ
jgi:hypothetical protein